MTLYRATIVDTPSDPFTGTPAGALNADQDGAIVVQNGLIVARGPYGVVRGQYPDEPVDDLRTAILVPGFVDTHVHYPQIRAIGGLGTPLLDWLELCALPQEAKLVDRTYAQAVADEFLDGLVRSGTTSALVFGAHFAPAMDILFAGAQRHGLNVTAGLVVSDRILRDDLLTTPERALAESRALIGRWHGRGRAQYAVTPRFSSRRPTPCWPPAPSSWPRPTSASPRTSTRTWPRSPPSQRCSRAPGTTSTATTVTAWSPIGASSPTTSTRATPN